MGIFIKSYIKELKLATHDIGIILFLAFLPLAYPIIYSLIYNPEQVRDVRMVVVDHDRSALSRELVRNLDATQEIRIIGYASDLGEGKKAMNSHECYGILEIPEGFERKVGRGESSPAVLYSEMSLLLRYRGFLVATTNVAQAMGSEILTEKISESVPLAETLVSGDPLGVQNVVMGNLESGFDSFIMPGVLVLILQQCLILAIGMTGGAKREKPWLYSDIDRATFGGTFKSMAGSTLAYLTIIIVPCIYMLHYVPMMFRFPMAGNPWEIQVFILPMVIASIAVGMIFQAACRERESVFVLWVVTSVAFLFLSGLTWPRYAMAPFWKGLSDLVPATFGVEGFIRMNTNGASLAQVSGDYIALWIQAVGYSIIAFLVQRFYVMPTRIKAVKEPGKVAIP
ncbi:MAG: ABC transporter permease [Muribaculaceae bacterium]|nr:ABC transporter permease [Muribaculaceae bacterium]MDE6553080.1 ABC transporter permease [Muribaculaceae bacterium]